MQKQYTFLVAKWGKWSEWSACSSTCSEGLKTRTRQCKNGHYGEGSCFGDVLMSDLCNMTCRNGSTFVVGEFISFHFKFSAMVHDVFF